MNANFALQDRFLKRFFAGPLGEHFYLTGETALARFYFYHRESLDLDLFTNDFGQDFAQVNQVILGILHALTLRITSQVFTDTFIQYIVTDPDGNSQKVDLVKDVPVHFGSLFAFFQSTLEQVCHVQFSRPFVQVIHIQSPGLHLQNP